MAYLGVSTIEDTGERRIPPVSKFNAFLDNFINQVNQSPTAEFGQTAGIELIKLQDNSPIVPDEEIGERNKKVPGLEIPTGTRRQTFNAITENQVKRNYFRSISNDPANNGFLGWSGKIAGGTGRFILDPTVVASALTGISAAGGLVGTSLLPEMPYFAEKFPQLSVEMGKGLVEGGVFGVTSGGIESLEDAAQRKVERGEGTTAGQIVRQTLNTGQLMGVGGALLPVAGRAISKGFKLIQGAFTDNPLLDTELAKRIDEVNKPGIQERVSKMQETHKEAALENQKSAQESVENTRKGLQDSITKFEKERPESKGSKGMSSYLDTIDKSDSPHDVKMQSYALIKKPLSELSESNNNILRDELKNVDGHIFKFNDLLEQEKAAQGIDSLEGILSDFRMITPNDMSALKKIGVAQLEQGREVDVAPYLSEAVVQNAKVLRDRLTDEGFNKGKVLHAIFDSLDAIKDREAGLEEGIKSAKEELTNTADKEERSVIQGVINGRVGLKSAVTQQRAVHELLATAVSDEFNSPSDEEISTYLGDQTASDHEKGTFQSLANELSGETPEERIERLAQEPAPITAESTEELDNINEKVRLAPNVAEAAVKCLLGV